MTTQIPNSMLVSPGGGLVQSGAIAASATLAPNATAVQNAIAAAAGGGAAVSIVAGFNIPLDTAGNGKSMASQILSLNSVFTFSGGVEVGSCNFFLVADGLHVPDLSAFIPAGETTIANNYVYKVAAGTRNFYAAVYTQGIVLLYGQSAGVTIIAPGAATLAAGASTQNTQALTITAPVTGSAPTSYATFYKRAIDPSYTAGPTGTSLSVSITALVAGTSYNYKTVASNTAGAGPDSNVLTVSTAAATPAPVFSAQSAPSGVNSTPYTYTFAASNTTSFALFSGSLPPGIGLNTATGVISGSPTTTATSAFVISATGPGGTTNSTTQSVTIAASAVVNQRFTTFDSANLVESGTGPYSYSDSVAGNANAATSSVKFPAGIAASLTYKLTATGTVNTLYATLSFDTDRVSAAIVSSPISVGASGGANYVSGVTSSTVNVLVGSYMRLRRDAANVLYAEASADNVTWATIASVAGANVDYWPKFGLNPTTGGLSTFQSFSNSGMV